MGEQRVFPEAQKNTGQEYTAAEALPLITTKIRVPRRRRDLLPRRRLVNFIHGHLDRKLILISAPAGYGKTSLLTDFAQDADLPICWYTLDPFDRDLHLFLEHLIAAIARQFPAFGQRSQTFLRETRDLASNLYPLVATLVQEIYDTIPEYFFLVLDDHHTVEEQEQINEFLDLFLTYVDENCHLIIASRTLPALPNLSLLVARRQAAGLSIDELRFTPHEIQALARQNYDLELSLEQAGQLAERTGGWITGLLLTAAQRWEQAHGEVPVRGRINVDVYDYLSRQVLDRQPDSLRSFLLHSSVLDEMSPELCATVLEIESPAELMDMVLVRNLFVIEFEGEEKRLRYHDLFREFLQDTLRQRSEARYRELTLRAANAYADRREWERAVSRYLALERYEPVLDILRQTGARLYGTGRWDTLATWLDALPEPVQTAHPNLLVHRGEIHMERGEYDSAMAQYERAEEAFGSADNDTGRAYALAMKGYVLRFQGHYAEAIARCQQALRLVSGATPEEPLTMALTHKNIGLCQFRLGGLVEGQQALHKALSLYESLGDLYNVANVRHDLGWASELAGDLPAAVDHYQSALETWQELGNLGPWALTLNGLGVVYHLLGRYDKSLQILNGALSKAQRAGALRVEAFVLASLGDLHRDLGALQRAHQAYSQALEVATRIRVGFILTYALNALGNVARLQGDLAGSEAQLQEALARATEHKSAYEVGLCHASLGILACQQEALDTARHHLDRAVEIFAQGGFRRDLALAQLHRSHIAYLAGDRAGALTGLQQTLDLADSLGFDQFLVVEGQQLTGLLHYAQEQQVDSPALPDLLERIEDHRARLAARPEPTVQVVRGQALKIFALGPPRVEMEGQSIQWPTTQSRDLFFCLLEHPQGLRKEEVGGIFWPEHPPHRLDGIFRSTLYRLRRAVFRQSVVYEDGRYRFNWQSDHWFDVEAFEQLLDQAGEVPTPDQGIKLLEEALDHYQGDYLEGVYDDWTVLERERLRGRRLDALESLAGLFIGQGNLRRAIEGYQHLVSHDPYREPAHRELMRCHYYLGDRVAAIRQYQSCVQILRDDLGLSPAPETEELYLQIIG
jgi:ATP/maltotriose-dependent transcriptional regulator MalT/DNA-binding SARP family transcriptional activator